MNPLARILAVVFAPALPRAEQAEEPPPAPEAAVPVARELAPADPVPPGCLPGPRWDDLDADSGMLTSAGLSRDQVERAVDGSWPELRRCLSAGGSLQAAALADITVACTGRVDRVRVEGDLPAEVAGCLEEALAATTFPPHDIPGGFEFGYALELTWVAGR